MDMTVAREDRSWCGVFNEKEEVANANYPLIREFDVDFTPAAAPQEEVTGKWEVVSPQTVGHLSYDSIPAKGGAEAIKREAQLQNLSIPHTAMIVAIDNADPNRMHNVHPKNKQEIGRRLALAAGAIAYGDKQMVYSGPVYEKMNAEGNSIRLHFKHIGSGLMTKDGVLKGFAIAGDDKKFVWANATIEGNSVVVFSSDVSKPVAVRYGWSNNPPTGLYNKENLPASPFRTDSWEKQIIPF